jgi:hypothetical protein
MEDNFHLTNKKGLLTNFQEYYKLQGRCAFAEKIFPTTFLIESANSQDPEYRALSKYVAEHPESIWILKPGEDSNRGSGISICKSQAELDVEIKNLKLPKSGKKVTLIVQSYIGNPLLIKKRKFDIRVYGMLTSVYGSLKGYFFEDGYMRTSSKEFSLSNL